MTLQIQQTAASILDYTIDYLTRGIPYGSIITGSVWAVSPAGPTLTNEAIIQNGTMTAVTITGGTPDQIYLITNTVTFSTGQVMQETIALTVINTQDT